MTTEILIGVIVRGVLGVFLAVFLGLSVWMITWLYLQTVALGSTSFIVVQSAVVGAPAGLGAAVAWWNTESGRKVRGFALLVAIGAAFLGAWLAVEVRGIDTHFALFGGSSRVEVLSLGNMVATLTFASVIMGNATAAAFYIYRATRHREV
jgi:hypothetical protein